MKHMRPLIALIVIALMTIACGVSAGGNGNTPQVEITLENGEQLESQNEAPTEVQTEPFLNAPGIGQIRLLTEVQNVGEKPLFAWESIPGANRYHLIVFDETGEPYWAWEGAQTQVYMGGSETQPPADSDGPLVGAGYAWTVVAYDANGKILASSELRSISP